MNISPVCAGVIPALATPPQKFSPFPRTRGGDPGETGECEVYVLFSPVYAGAKTESGQAGFADDSHKNHNDRCGPIVLHMVSLTTD